MKEKFIKSKKILIATTIVIIIAIVFCLYFVAQKTETQSEFTKITFEDGNVNVNGKLASQDFSNAVYIDNDIIYYEAGKDFTYGEGSEKDAHSKSIADAHTVIHITKAGTYSIEGTLDRGQIAIDLGEGAKDDPSAAVTLILNGTDITCEVAPAIIFYNVYECGSDDTNTASKDVDTSKAGANVIIADDTENVINGSYVERIYKPGTVVLNEDKTQVEDAEKLHKYDGAFYSKMSMNINGQEKGTGVLNINAQNEGLDSELHLTINGGNINIKSGNDGINTNEDGVSVTTVNGGSLNIQVTGETGEGDGIDSNGWLVINGGKVIAEACSSSADAGIDSDMGIFINGGTVIASGHMLDRIEDGGQNYVLFRLPQGQKLEASLLLKNENDSVVSEFTIKNDFSILIYSSEDLGKENYFLYNESGILLSNSSMNMDANQGNKPEPPFSGDMRPDGNVPPGDFTPPDGFKPLDKL